MDPAVPRSTRQRFACELGVRYRVFVDLALLPGALAGEVGAVIPTVAVPIGVAGQTGTVGETNATRTVAVRIMDLAAHVTSVACADEGRVAGAGVGVASIAAATAGTRRTAAVGAGLVTILGAV